MRVVPAQEILDKIERGEPVAYDHVIVEGDLDRLELPKRRVNRTDLENYWSVRGCYACFVLYKITSYSYSHSHHNNCW